MYCFEKLKLNKDFRRIYGRGSSFVNPAFVTYVLKNRNNSIRMGITVSKKIGGAVERNRAKRVITAAFRECAPQIAKGYDFVFVTRTRISKSKSQDIAADMLENLKAANVITKTDE